MAARRLNLLRAKNQPSTERPGLIDYVAEQLPEWARFDYFAPYSAALETCIGAELRLCFAAPPGHGKTEFTLRGLLWLCRYYPGYRHAFVTYNDVKTKAEAARFQIFAREAGFEVAGTLDQVVLQFPGQSKRSTIKFSSVGGSLTGFPIDGLFVIDDAIAGRKEARSAAIRRNVVEFWKSVARTRRHKGTSYVVMATRWPGGDLTDHLTKNEGFRYINLKAIAAPTSPEDVDEATGAVLSDPLGRQPGEALSPRKPPEFFAEDRADLFWWSSMFQGEPRPEGASVFARPGAMDEETGQQIGPAYYSKLPTQGYRVAYGVDLAYSARTSADWSILVEAWASEGKLYIVNVTRKQVPATSFLLTLLAARTNRPGAPFRFYGGGTEKGSADFIKQKLGRIFHVLPASVDKLVRANATSITWNTGRVLLPDPAKIKAPWLDDFLAVVTTFTGTPGEQDDDVDALAAAHDQLMRRTKMFEALTGAKS